MPRDQTLKRPVNDKYVFMNSKPFEGIKLVQTTKQQTQSRISSQIIEQKDRLIQQYKKQIENEKKLLSIQKQQIQKYERIIYQIKEVLKQPQLLDQNIVGQIKKLLQKINSLEKHILKNYNANNNGNSGNISDANEMNSRKLKQYQQLCLKKQQQIKRLRAQLLQSTANNINSLFDTQINESQCIVSQINTLREDFQKLNLAGGQNKKQSKNQQNISTLIRKYEQVLQLYHKNEKLMYQFQVRQEQNFCYFSSLRVQLNNQILHQCNGYTNHKISQLQKQIQILSKAMSQSQQKFLHVSQQKIDKNEKVQQISKQVQSLKLRLGERQKQIDKIKQVNKQLLLRTKAFENAQVELQNLNILQSKVKQKDIRISQLQQTIMQHIDSKIRSQSINSQQQDIQKLRNSIRNLKAIITNLKQQNKVAKQKIKELNTINKELRRKIQNCMSSGDEAEQSRIVEKVSRDQGTLRVVEDIVGVLIGAEADKKCKCLEKTTDCLINLNQEYPQIQELLESLGVMQKTTNLLPIQQ